MPYVFVFIASLARPLDLDLGWHLKYGEYFWKTGQILRENIFSSEMLDYQYINHSWAMDVFTYIVFNKFGFAGLSILSAIVVALTFYFFAYATRLSFWEKVFIFPLILYVSYDGIGISFRSQLLSILFLGVTCFLLRTFEERKKTFILWIMVPLFLVWANIHGGFILGLTVFGTWCALDFYKKIIAMYSKKQQFAWSIFVPQIIGIFSALATLVNPFGRMLYEEIFRHLGSPMQKFVIEWMPIYKNTFLLRAYLISSVLLIIGIFLFYRKKQKTELLYITIPMIIFWIIAFQQRRYLWPAFFIAMPFWGAVTSFIKPKNNKIVSSIAIGIVFCSYLFVSIYNLPKQNIFKMDWIYYCRINGCSQSSSEYLIKNKLSGKILTDYNFGGWLIWNYPEIKPSIDGRMPFWKDDTGDGVFPKYIELENNFADINNSEYDIVYISPTKTAIFNRLQQLVNEKKWNVAYHDLFAYVFVRVR
ncbi:MAG: hypothetical protein AAB795_03615 [Patescibacteria group bacterium]